MLCFQVCNLVTKILKILQTSKSPKRLRVQIYTICPHFANLTTPIADLTTAIIYNSTPINAFSTSTIDDELAKNDPAEAEYFPKTHQTDDVLLKS